MKENSSQNILLVDDREENLLVLEHILEAAHISFIKTNSGEGALRELLKHDVSLILLDVQMPGMDGFETATLIRGAQKTKHIPIIFVTAISKEQKHIFKGYETGAVDYLFKPLDPDILKSKVQIFLELDRQKRILEKRNLELETVRQNTNKILENVKDGFFLLDGNYKIKPQYSLALKNILSHDQLDELDFLEFLRHRIPIEAKTSVEEYLELMFQNDVDENNLVELNPLDILELNFDNFNQNTVSKKILSFHFKRVLDKNNQIAELIGTAKDITEATSTAKKLKESEAYSKKQLAWLFNILHIEPELLKEFIEGLQKELNYIAGILKQSEKRSNFDEILKQVFRSVHLIKGNAGLLELKFFTTMAHTFEEEILILQSKPDIQGSDFISLVLKLTELQNTLDELNNLINRIQNIHKYFRPKRNYEKQLFIQSLKNFIKSIADELNKEVKFDYKDFDAGEIPYQYRLVIKEILIQLIKNAIHHGIENKKERIDKNKNSFGIIKLSSFKKNNKIGFRLRDDGSGLQLKKLRQKAKSSGKWKKTDVDQMDDKQVTAIIFQQGISTSKSVNINSGRGVGLASVEEKIKKLGGQIEVYSEDGKYCEFVINLPFKTDRQVEN